MVSSSGKSTRSRLAICSGLHDLAQRRSARRPWRRPMKRTSWPGHQLTGGRGDHPGQAILHVLAQRLVRSQLGHLGPAGAPFGMPLRGRRPVLHPVTASRCVAAQFPRDRRWRPAHPAGDLAHPALLRAQNRDLLPLGERQVPPRQRGQGDRTASRQPHGTTGSRPAATRRPRPPRPRSTQPSGDRSPEPLPMLPPRQPAAGPATASGRASHESPAGVFPAPISPHLQIEVLRRPVESALGSRVGVEDRAGRGRVGDGHVQGAGDQLVRMWSRQLPSRSTIRVARSMTVARYSHPSPVLR